MSQQRSKRRKRKRKEGEVRKRKSSKEGRVKRKRKSRREGQVKRSRSMSRKRKQFMKTTFRTTGWGKDFRDIKFKSREGMTDRQARREALKKREMKIAKMSKMLLGGTVSRKKRKTRSKKKKKVRKRVKK